MIYFPERSLSGIVRHIAANTLRHYNVIFTYKNTFYNKTSLFRKVSIWRIPLPHSFETNVFYISIDIGGSYAKC